MAPRRPKHRWREAAVTVVGALLGARSASAELEYELAVPACAGLSAGDVGCFGARRHELDEAALDTLALLETDAECVASLGQLSAVRDGGPAPPALATCALPAALSLEVFATAASLQASCRSAPPLGQDDRGAPPCDAPSAIEAVRKSYGRFRALMASAAAALALPPEVLTTVRRYSLEEAETVGRLLSGLWTQEATGSWAARPATLAAAALDACRRLGLGRRVLFWRSNLLQSVVEFGLAGYLPLVAPRDQFFNSRVEVLADLLDGPPADGRRLVEVGVHLARVAFALLSTLHGLHYIGVDPFVYDGAVTPRASADRQLRDLGLAPESEGGRGAEELKGEVRQGAEAKLALFPGRAQLLPLASVEAASRLPDQSVDGVFIDGDHSYAQVLRDIQAWERKVRPGGFLSGHDFGNHPDVARAVLERAAAGNRTVHLAMDWVWYWRV